MAEIIPFPSTHRAAQTAHSREEDFARDYARYVQHLRLQVASDFIIAEYPLTIMRAFIEGEPPGDCAEFLRELRERA